MEQGQLVIALLGLLVLGIGAVAMVAMMGAKSQITVDVEDDARLRAEMDQLTLARRRRHFRERYPDWAGRDFESDLSSPWYSDPEFADTSMRRLA